MDWWSENWQFVVGTGIGIIVGVGIALWQRQPKRLDYDIINNVPILSSQTGHISERLQVEYDGMIVEEPRIVTIRIENTGKRAVEPDEYEIPITITYQRNHPFDGFISNVSSQGISAEIDLPVDDELESEDPSGIIIIKPGLLNRGEWLDVQLISDGNPGTVKVFARFTDQSRPMRKKSESPVPTLISYVLGMIIGSLAALLLFFLMEYWTGFIWVFLALFVVVIVSLMTYTRRKAARSRGLSYSRDRRRT